MEKDRMYVLKKEVVGKGMGALYGAFTTYMTPDIAHGHMPATRIVVEPQREISDLVKFLKYGYRQGVACIPRRFPSRFSFDRPSEIPEFTAELHGRGRPAACVKYTSLSYGERKEFMTEMSGFPPRG